MTAIVELQQAVSKITAETEQELLLSGNCSFELRRSLGLCLGYSSWLPALLQSPMLASARCMDSSKTLWLLTSSGAHLTQAPLACSASGR